MEIYSECYVGFDTAEWNEFLSDVINSVLYDLFKINIEINRATYIGKHIFKHLTNCANSQEIIVMQNDCLTEKMIEEAIYDAMRKALREKAFSDNEICIPDKWAEEHPEQSLDEYIYSIKDTGEHIVIEKDNGEFIIIYPSEITNEKIQYRSSGLSYFM